MPAGSDTGFEPEREDDMRKAANEMATELDVFIELSPADDLRPVLEHVSAQLAPSS